MMRHIPAICALALIFLSPASGAATGSVEFDALQAAANRLIDRVSSLAVTDPGTPGAIASWMGARAGIPLAVWGYQESKASYAIVPVLSVSEDLVGTIGMGIKSGDWEWYAEAHAGAQPWIAADEALRILHDRTGKSEPAMTDMPRVVSMADRHLYWYSSWVDPNGLEREFFVDLWDPERVLTEATLDEAGLTQSRFFEGSQPSVELQGVRSPSITLDPDYPPQFSLNVPHHFQETPYNCGPAALHMIFDYWGEEIVQSEIARAANTISSYGTPRSDLRRAAHFSYLSTAVRDPLLVGYEKRDLGYAAIEAEWSGLANYESRYEDLKTLISSGYPLILATWFDNSFTVGHYRVLKGYKDPSNLFIVHDPWYSGPYQGPNLFFQQHILVDILWRFPDFEDSRWALLAAPWDVEISAPDSVAIGERFTVSAVVTYPGPHPFEGQAITSDVRAMIELDPGLRLVSGEDGMELLGGINATGTADSVSWQVVAALDGMIAPVGLTVSGIGVVIDSSLTYPEYTDEIGGSSRAVVVVTDRMAVIHHNIESEPGLVSFLWQLNRQIDLADLSLTAMLGEEKWAVPILKNTATHFSACDQARQLAAGGRVTYSLCIRSGSECVVLRSDVVDVESSITATRLLGALPNPSRPPVNVSFLVDHTQRVRVEVYDCRGRLVAVPTDQSYEIGWHVVAWDGRDAAGRMIPSGTYLLRLDADGVRESRKLLLAK